ncbi:anoctamin-4-like isoform X5 [Convolutriloba macropyga]|uniref:anoctamin-4-like isoform X5 n=1 Tax=Convolutriloba macropyga TaxID=536237 RepID=UPI003F51DA8D
MANIGWNVPGRQLTEDAGGENPSYVMSYDGNAPLPPIPVAPVATQPDPVRNGDPNLPYPNGTFAEKIELSELENETELDDMEKSDPDSTGANASGQPLLGQNNNASAPPPLELKPIYPPSPKMPEPEKGAPGQDEVHEDIAAANSVKKVNAPMLPKETGIEAKVSANASANLKHSPLVPDEELKACFTVFDDDPIPKRIDFVLVHQMRTRSKNNQQVTEEDINGSSDSLAKKKKSDDDDHHHVTPKESRRIFTENLRTKGLLLKAVRCGEGGFSEPAMRRKLCKEKSLSRKISYTGLKSVSVSGHQHIAVNKARYMHQQKENDLVFTLCHAPDELLLKWCEILRMKLPLQQCDAETGKQTNFFGKLWEKVPNMFEPFEFKQTVPESQDPYSYFTAVFTEARKDKFAIQKMGGVERFLTVGDRNRIVYNILSRTEYDSEDSKETEDDADDVLNKKFGIERMIDEQIYTGAYPLHSGEYWWDPIEMGMPWHECEYLTDRQKLFYSWADWRTWYKKQPMTLIRRYFGEKIGIYFAWLGFYTWFLFPAAVLGFFCFLYGCLTMATDDISREVCDDGPAANYTMCPLCDKACKFWKLGDSCLQVKVSRMIDNEATIVFALFMSLWGTLFLEFWKRTKNELSYEWDLFDYEEGTQTVRPQFERKARLAVSKNKKSMESWWQINPITLMTEPFMPITTRLPKLCASISVVFFMISVVLATVIGVVMYRALAAYFFVKQEFGPTWSSILTSCTASTVNLMFIFAFSRFYNILAFKLTEFECPRTDSEFDNSYTLKMFVFQFVNYYSSIFYIAFFKGRFGGYPSKYALLFGKYRLQECGPGGCLFDLMTQLGIIMVGKQLYSNLQEIGMPMLKKWLASRKFRNQQADDENDDEKNGSNPEIDEKKLHRWEKDYILSAWPPLNLFYEYLEMVIQFGFTTLFVAAFPLAPFFAFLNNVIEIRLDAYKFITQLRRPWAQKAEDIGSWYNILQAIAIIAVLTNACIIAFSSRFIERWYYARMIDGNSTIYFDFILSVAESVKVKGFNASLELTEITVGESCRYQGFRFPYDAPENLAYQYTPEFYKLLALRLAFVLLFENIVFALRSLIAYLIPDMPVHVRIEKAREEYLTRQVLYESEKLSNRLSQPPKMLQTIRSPEMSNTTSANVSPPGDYPMTDEHSFYDSSFHSPQPQYFPYNTADNSNNHYHTQRTDYNQDHNLRMRGGGGYTTPGFQGQQSYV